MQRYEAPSNGNGAAVAQLNATKPRRPRGPRPPLDHADRGC